MTGVEVRTSSAVYLYDVDQVTKGVRVDFVFDVERPDEQEKATLNLQVFYLDQGEQETVGYLRDSQLLLKEYYTIRS